MVTTEVHPSGRMVASALAVSFSLQLLVLLEISFRRLAS